MQLTAAHWFMCFENTTAVAKPFKASKHWKAKEHVQAARTGSFKNTLGTLSFKSSIDNSDQVSFRTARAGPKLLKNRVATTGLMM